MAKRVGTAVRLANCSTIELLDKRKAVLHLISTIESSTIESSPSTISPQPELGTVQETT
ncbi:hypothetical protein ERO13_D11G094150v2 [Gossypium hirsutum]|uniref:Uncharacterized protein n=3 Tax=Gossypium TaxID=3633 RepID=A0A5D2SQV9_GOSMU|nr:hypothetical protein ERO13_D11G094150v2 [Gossypium hirsutum]TYG44531.1 hypothetical protein ES288_D11G103500v1 [Gossypium darwinii]TYH43052.1 hypothetical protein ES332_D11G101600v1 [Gossypium tomentosum]TYI54856.1 hypothetical protein E1A91_D11G101700v1 [Gossypium mustelinum]